jgi:phosphoribosylformylglycinamidine synthase PurS subunit
VIRLGVCGWPVGHSRSPRMHNAALAAVGLHDWRYQHLPLPPGLFAETVRALPALGFRGVANVHVGRLVELDVDDPGELDAMCRRLLANPLIEDYEILEAAAG